MKPFFHYALRTTDAQAARRFYRTVLGDRDLVVLQLHEQALARGARPHWLGYVEVGRVDRAASMFVERGGVLLARWNNADGLEAAVLRDPGGAVVALAKPPPNVLPRTDVVWHLLHTTDLALAKASYAHIAGWDFRAPQPIPGLGEVHPFAWQAGGEVVGAIAASSRPGIHPHWLFHFRVPALEPALDAVRAGGGVVVEQAVSPGGTPIAVCDDAQGAAFALWQAAVP